MRTTNKKIVTCVWVVVVSRRPRWGVRGAIFGQSIRYCANGLAWRPAAISTATYMGGCSLLDAFANKVLAEFTDYFALIPPESNPFHLAKIEPRFEAFSRTDKWEDSLVELGTFYSQRLQEYLPGRAFFTMEEGVFILYIPCSQGAWSCDCCSVWL